MRTTLTLDEDVDALLKRVRKAKKGSLKAVVNEALRQGLRRMISPEPRRTRYQTRAVSLGECRLANMDDISEALAAGEGEHFS